MKVCWLLPKNTINLLLYKAKIALQNYKLCTYVGAETYDTSGVIRGVTAIVIKIGRGNQGSNLERVCLHFI